MNICGNTCTYVCVSVHRYVNLWTCVCVCVRACVRMFVNVCGAAMGLPRLWVVFKAQLCDPHPKGHFIGIATMF